MPRIIPLYCFYFCTFAAFYYPYYLQMKAKKILYISQEIAPYVPDSEMSLCGRKVTQSVQEKGCEIRAFMPKWGCVNERRGQLHEVIRLSRMMLIIDDTAHPLILKVASIPQTRIQVYFIDNEDYFAKRGMAFDDNGQEYADNGERAIFYARSVLETVKKLRWVPDIIHVQGWMGSVLPLYIRTAYKDEPTFASAKIVTSLFSEELTASLGPNFKKCIEFRNVKQSLINKYNKNFGFSDLQRMAIDYSDGIVNAGANVNPAYLAYAQEKNKPMMTHPADEALISETYTNFYDSLLDEDK